MAQELGTGKGGGGGPEMVGCMDPTALNYNGFATVPCGPNGPYQPDLGGVLTSGCCQKLNTTPGGGGEDDGALDLAEMDGNPGGSGNNSNDDNNSNEDNDVIDLNPILCPTQLEMVITTGGVVLDSQGNNLPPECCDTHIVGTPVSYVSNLHGRGACMVTNESNPCPTINELSISPLDQVTIIGIDNPECCNQNVVGQPVSWLDGDCKLVPQNTTCFFDSIFLNPYLAPNLPPTTNIQQVIGSLNGISTALNQECCTNEVAGFPVQWNGNLNICQTVTEEGDNPSNLSNVTISLNQELISPKECDDLLISVKLFFKEPTQECTTEVITASILPTHPSITVEQLGIFTSDTDGFNNWVDLGCRLINANNNSFNLDVVIAGLANCCDYDVRIDNVRVDCYKEEDRVFWDNKKCPGFDLQRVIDNKKSWVYNPGTFTGVTEQDSIIIKGGDETLIQGFGVINRTFAPSPDADIPWRYTDYWEQSNIMEPHTKQVINSKEMELTFNMCGQCCVEYSPCPPGFTLSAGTATCFKVLEEKQFQDGWDFDFQDGIPYDFMDF